MGMKSVKRPMAGASIAGAALILVGLPNPAVAQGDVFVVARVPVQAVAETATTAKNQAQSYGRRRAIDILLRRLTPESDWALLPPVQPQAETLEDNRVNESDQPTGLPALEQDLFALPGKQPISLTPNELLSLEQSFEVYDEKSSSKTYRAYITYRFKPDSVRRLLKDAAIPYSEAQTQTALVLPVLRTNAGAYLWERNNPWMAAWKSRPFTHELTPFVAPDGSIEDEASITAQQALALDSIAASELAQRYDVSQVVVAVATLRQAGGSDRLSVRLLNAYSEAVSADDTTLDDIDGTSIEDLIASSAGTVRPPTRPRRRYAGNGVSADVGEVIASASGSQASGNFPVLAEQMIEKVITNYASGWKQNTLIDHSSDAILNATAFFDDLAEWSKIRDALVDTPLVGAVQVSALSPKGAEMAVRVFGDPSRLATALENQGLVFWTETGHTWLVAVPTVAAGLRGERFLSKQGRGQRSLESGPQGNSNTLAPAYGEFDEQLGQDVDPSG
ncbi:MAG: DUF2066 domain-containing protein [Pseudomonadota bacterium]